MDFETEVKNIFESEDKDTKIVECVRKHKEKVDFFNSKHKRFCTITDRALKKSQKDYSPEVYNFDDVSEETWRMVTMCSLGEKYSVSWTVKNF